MPLRQLALVSEVREFTASQVARVGAAIQKQAVRDLGPPWGVQAAVHAFPKLADVPDGYWPIIIRTKLGVPGAAGVHMDKHGQPYALVQASRDWPLTASHEACEMLVDPLGNRLQAAPSVKPGQGGVRYLVEVCDPCEAPACAYDVDGISVSDFYLPGYFSGAARRRSHTGALTAPRQVLRGGYLSWQVVATGHWWQATWFDGARPAFRELGRLVRRKGKSWRETIDAMTDGAQRLKQGAR